MKRKVCIIVFTVLSLLLISVISSEAALQTIKGEPLPTLTVQLINISDGQTWFTNDSTHSGVNAVKLVIPSIAQQSSGCMALYPYNKPLNSLMSFQIYTSYTNATPRFVIQLDTNHDAVTDVVLLSDYQFLSNEFGS